MNVVLQLYAPSTRAGFKVDAVVKALRSSKTFVFGALRLGESQLPWVLKSPRPACMCTSFAVSSAGNHEAAIIQIPKPEAVDLQSVLAKQAYSIHQNPLLSQALGGRSGYTFLGILTIKLTFRQVVGMQP